MSTAATDLEGHDDPDTTNADRRSISVSRNMPQAPGQDAGDDSCRIIVPAATTGGDEAMLRDLADDDDQDLCSMLIKLQDHHWRIRKADLEILVRPDGSDWLLGSGAYAKVQASPTPEYPAGHTIRIPAKVYRGILNKSIPVAIKTIDDQRDCAKKSFIEEVVALMNLRNGNIIQFYGAVIEDSSVLLITEFMPRGSLYDAIAKDKEGKLTWFGRGRALAQDITRGLMHMHCCGFIHQDVKSKNVLISKDYTAKLSDMGLFSMPNRNSPERSQIRRRTSSVEMPGTFEWLAPEVLLGGPSASSFKADIYSLGVVLGEIITGNPPLGRSVDIRSPEQCPQQVADLVHRCMEEDPADRPTIQEVFDILSEHLPPKTRPLEARAL